MTVPNNRPPMSGDPSVSSESLADAQRIVDTIHEPLLVLGDDLSVRQVNPAFYETFSTSEGETIEKHVFELGGGHFDVPRLREAIESLQTRDEAIRGLEIDRVFEGLGRRVLQINGRRLEGTWKEEGTDPDGPPSRLGRILLAINDVTEHRRLEDHLLEKSRELERSNKDLEQFAYAASHDLQEPLRMVSSYLQLLERRYRDSLNDEAQEFIDYAVDGANRMRSLINGLLQYSRVGRKEGEFEELDLQSVVEDVIQDLSREIDELDASVSCASIPPVYGNRDQLRRLFQNVIDNALTYRGEDPPEVSVRGEKAPTGEVHVVIEDNGPGIPEAGQEKIFQIFKQLDPHGTGQSGSGMGLALCRKIAERHNGRMWVESEEGEGSAFHVTLCLAETD